MHKQQIPLLNLESQYAEIGSQLEEAVLSVLRSGSYILGKWNRELEEKIAKLCQCRFGIGVGNGTDALILALWALDIGPGDEVITTPFTFAATAEAIVLRGATPIFVDIDEHSFNINPALIEEAITKKTRAIMPVHLYGQPADMSLIMEIAKKHKLFIIEDNAQAIGASYKGRATGCLSDIACLSFYPTKNLGAAGDGGMIVTNNEELSRRVRSLRAHGMCKRYYHDELGVNSRLDEMQAAILSAKLPYLRQWSAGRQAVAAAYSKALAGCPNLVVPKIHLASLPGADASELVEHVWHQYTICISAGAANGKQSGMDDATARVTVSMELTKRGIASMCYYPVPLHLQKAFSKLGYKLGDFPITEKLAGQVLSIPMYPELKQEQINYIAASLHEIMAERAFTVVPTELPQPAGLAIANI